jgi:GNAT superfamily N-acetyltransferase
VIAITPAEPTHATAISVLAEEMDRFYGATSEEPRDLRLRQINDALFSEQPSAFALLAWDDDRLTGFAAYSYLWPAVGLTRSLFLKELYVAEDGRRRGTGQLLMHRLFEIAVQQGCSRVEWQTETSNAAARAFYHKIGAPELQGKVSFRLEGEELLRAAGHAVLDGR